MPDDKSNKGTDVNWSHESTAMFLEVPDNIVISTKNVEIEIDDRGIIIKNKHGIEYLNMSYGDITEIISRIDSAEAEIGKLIDIINGMKEVGY